MGSAEPSPRQVVVAEPLQRAVTPPRHEGEPVATAHPPCTPQCSSSCAAPNVTAAASVICPCTPPGGGRVAAAVSAEDGMPRHHSPPRDGRYNIAPAVASIVEGSRACTPPRAQQEGIAPTVLMGGHRQHCIPVEVEIIGHATPRTRQGAEPAESCKGSDAGWGLSPFVGTPFQTPACSPSPGVAAAFPPLPWSTATSPSPSPRLFTRSPPSSGWMARAVASPPSSLWHGSPRPSGQPPSVAMPLQVVTPRISLPAEPQLSSPTSGQPASCTSPTFFALRTTYGVTGAQPLHMPTPQFTFVPAPFVSPMHAACAYSPLHTAWPPTTPGMSPTFAEGAQHLRAGSFLTEAALHDAVAEVRALRDELKALRAQHVEQIYTAKATSTEPLSHAAAPREPRASQEEWNSFAQGSPPSNAFAELSQPRQSADQDLRQALRAGVARRRSLLAEARHAMESAKAYAEPIARSAQEAEHADQRDTAQASPAFGQQSSSPLLRTPPPSRPVRSGSAPPTPLRLPPPPSPLQELFWCWPSAEEPPSPIPFEASPLPRFVEQAPRCRSASPAPRTPAGRRTASVRSPPGVDAAGRRAALNFASPCTLLRDEPARAEPLPGPRRQSSGGCSVGAAASVASPVGMSPRAWRGSAGPVRGSHAPRLRSSLLSPPRQRGVAPSIGREHGGLRHLCCWDLANEAAEEGLPGVAAIVALCPLCVPALTPSPPPPAPRPAGFVMSPSPWQASEALGLVEPGASAKPPAPRLSLRAIA